MIRKTILLAGAFTFAFLLGEMVHELGHYFSHMAYGNDNIGVHLDPFGGSHITGVSTLPLKIMAATSAAGPLFNLLLGCACTFLLWKFRRPALLPFLLWGPVALVQEGVTFSLGTLTPGGDAAWIIAAGIPQPLILTTGILLFVTGITGVALLLPTILPEEDRSFWRDLLIVLLGMCTLMLARSAHSFLAAPESTMENLIPLIFSLVLATIVIPVKQAITRTLKKKPGAQPFPATWIATMTAVSLGTGMFTFQMLAFN